MLFFLSLIGVFWLGFFGRDYLVRNTPQNPIITKIIERPLDKYTIAKLSQTTVSPIAITIGENIHEEALFTSYLFEMQLDPALENGSPRKVTGLMNIPKGTGPFPVIVMFRGYVDQEAYQTGDGTRKSAEVFARNGFITVAPDFFGYGGSDPEAEDIFEARFQTYTTALTTLISVETIKEWNGRNIFIWGHSNGGQIALTALEITGKDYPTVLWAPVTKPFPYSILYYTDESEDRGKFIRKELAAFEELYDVEAYSIHNYYAKLQAPIELHQGTADDAVPVDWSTTFVKGLEKLEKNIDYYTYPGADHNLQPAWNTVVGRTVAFFKSFLNND